MRHSPHLSLLLPTYNGGEALRVTLGNLLRQDYRDYELIVNDDQSRDHTEEVVQSFGDPRIRFARNERNLGYPGNLEVCRQRASGDILFLMGQDDILARGAIRRTVDAFALADDVGAVTRPFFWFDTDIATPVRATDELNPRKDEVVRLTDPFPRVAQVFHTVGQLSGLALRRDLVDTPFHPDVFPSHIYPFASIMKRHPVAFLHGYPLAVRIATSQTRSVSWIYDRSPLQSWVDMYRSVFHEPEFRPLCDRLVRDHAAINYLGLVQIRNYSRHGLRYTLREAGLLVRHRPLNLVHPLFWLIALGCLALPPRVLVPFVDAYKRRVRSRSLRHIEFEYDL